jgi:hypothetical protein
MDVTGTWKGEYTFEEGEDGAGKQVAGVVVTFTLTLKKGWFGAFAGTVQEDARTGFVEAGTVKGRVRPGREGPVMVFEKLMPRLRMMHDGSRVTLEQWAERRKVVMNTDVAHPKIRHIGDISPDGRTVEGTWMQSEFQLSVPGSHERLTLPTIAGTWKLTRG